MNRLVPAQNRRYALMAAVWLLAPVDVSAQFTMPPNGAASNSPPAVAGASAPTAAVTMESGQQMLAASRKAFMAGDYAAAVEAFRSAQAISTQFPELAAQIKPIRERLIKIGIDPALLAMPPRSSSVTRMPNVSGATPMPASPSQATAGFDPKAEALRLVAIGRAALDRGDVTTALAIARKADALKVPESAFAAGEPRVWQLLLDTESAARRSGVMQTSGQMPTADGTVQPAMATEGPNPMAQMLFTTDGQNAAAGNQQAGGNWAGGNNAGGNVNQVQFQEPAPENRGTYAIQMFREGMTSLSEGDKPTAMKKFREAWKYEADLDVTSRNQLKDKLTLLQPTRLAPSPSDKSGEMTPMEKADLEVQEKTRRLYREVTSELAKAEQNKETAPLDALDQLEILRRRVDGSDLDDRAKRSLAVMVDRAVAEQKKFIDANRADINLELQNEAVRTEMDMENARAARIDNEVSVMVDEFNDLIRERRYQEAEVIAKQVRELKPNDPISISLFHTSRMGTRLLMNEEVTEAKELGFIDSMIDIERSSIAANPDLPMTLPEAQQWEALSRLRLGGAREGDSRLSPAEQVIQSKLTTPVNIKYENRALGSVLEDLSAVTGIPIVPDQRALGMVGANLETPITLQVPTSSIELKSALNLILEQLELTYVIENDVLTITSIEAKRSRTFVKTYRVTDLVTPIPNFTSSYEDGLAGALRNAYQMSNPRTDVQVMPVSAMDLGSGMAQKMSPMSMPGNNNVLGQYHAMGSQGGFGMGNPPMAGGGGGSPFANFGNLIQLIQTTIEPETWDLLGGPSAIQQFDQNLSLIINTTSEVHDQITELLASLRKLQNLQITIEVRFITLSDTFAEQIGVDFDVQFDDNTRTIPDDDAGPSVTVGFDGSNITPDLDIRFNNESFGTTPAFGSANLGSPSTLGFAILSDIEAFFFLQAAQADTRTNVMQAPKVTLFDGQFATISDVSQRPFVTSITPVVGDFAVAQQPVIVVLNEGTQLNVQGLVSDDKRFVRLTLVPFFSQIGDVTTFTYEGRRTSSSSSRTENDTNGDGVVDENDDNDTEEANETTVGTTVQLPTFAFTSVSTTVSVPDGGTILLGGIKRLSEGRAERGVPVLSKIPYVSRLFRNVAVGRTANSLMLMVTPRIIIQEEEELAQTGFDPTSQ